MPRSRSDASPEPPESETAGDQPASPLFLNPSDPATEDSPPPETPSWQPAGPSDPAGDSPGSDSKARSTERTLSPKARLRVFKGIARDAVTTAGAYANAILSRHPVDRELGVWTPDAEDVKEISEPLASIANRRIPKGTAADNPDAVDLARLGVGLVGYVLKSFRARARARADYAELYGPRGAETVAGDQAGDQTPDPAVPADRPDDMSPGRAFLSGRFGGSVPGLVAGDSPDPARAG